MRKLPKYRYEFRGVSERTSDGPMVEIVVANKHKMRMMNWPPHRLRRRAEKLLQAYVALTLGINCKMYFVPQGGWNQTLFGIKVYPELPSPLHWERRHKMRNGWYIHFKRIQIR
jgi:hypothetical protein